ncbi:hypothetical protein GCM10009682_09320 [Luedemannella flava]|uniref:Uncharacterized protein n=1 Tax=Luedemannella flava TaxID=349316 RepID=A0ABP4XRB9_9ACTN
MVGEDPAEARVGHERGALDGRYRLRRRTNLEIEVVTTSHRLPPRGLRYVECPVPATYPNERSADRMGAEKQKQSAARSGGGLLAV